VKSVALMRYALLHWDGLTLFLAKGLPKGPVKAESNTVERSIRATAHRRRSYQFAGAERGARK
jgi:hypothetical protein